MFGNKKKPIKATHIVRSKKSVSALRQRVYWDAVYYNNPSYDLLTVRSKVKKDA